MQGGDALKQDLRCRETGAAAKQALPSMPSMHSVPSMPSTPRQDRQVNRGSAVHGLRLTDHASQQRITSWAGQQ